MPLSLWVHGLPRGDYRKNLLKEVTNYRGRSHLGHSQEAKGMASPVQQPIGLVYKVVYKPMVLSGSVGPIQVVLDDASMTAFCLADLCNMKSGESLLNWVGSRPLETTRLMFVSRGSAGF